MATATTRTPTNAKTRSLELATARGYWSTCPPGRSTDMQLDDAGRLVSYTLEIPSASTVDTWHIVAYDARRDDASCDCSAAQHGQRACWHRGVGVRSGRYVARRAALGWPED